MLNTLPIQGLARIVILHNLLPPDVLAGYAGHPQGTCLDDLLVGEDSMMKSHSGQQQAQRLYVISL